MPVDVQLMLVGIALFAATMIGCIISMAVDVAYIRAAIEKEEKR